MSGVQKALEVEGRDLSLRFRGLIVLPSGGFFLRCWVKWEWRYVERIFQAKDATWAKACMGERAQGIGSFIPSSVLSLNIYWVPASVRHHPRGQEDGGTQHGR